MLGLGRGPPGAGLSDFMPWLLLNGLLPGRGVPCRIPWLLLNGLLPGRGPEGGRALEGRLAPEPGRGPGAGAGPRPAGGAGLPAAGLGAADCVDSFAAGAA